MEFANDIIGEFSESVMCLEVVLTDEKLLLRNKSNGDDVYCLGTLDLKEGVIVYPSLSRDCISTIAFSILHDHCKKLNK